MLQKEKKFIKFFFFIDIIGLMIILCCIFMTRTNVHNNFSKGTYTDISRNWYLDTNLTKSVTLEKLGKSMNPDTGVISVYSRIPNITMDTHLVYRTKDVSSRVYVDNELLFETNTPQSQFYNASPGNIWNTVIIPSKYANSLMQIEITMVYDTNAITLDHTFLGDETDIVLGLINQKSTALLISIFLCLTGLLFMFINIAILSAQNDASLSLLYLGIYAFFIGVWCMMETNIMQFFVQDARILQLVDNMAMIAGNIPLFLYLDSSYKILDKTIIRILCYINLIYIFACVVIQFTDKYDIHHLISFAPIFTIIFTFTYIVFFIYIGFKTFKEKQKMALEMRLQMFGLIILMVTGSAESIHYKYILTDGMDRAENIRLAMLFMVVIWGVSSQLQTIRLIEHGMQYNLISKMAYTDILTNLGNRTAYLEKLQSFEEKSTTFGIVYLDINNLKTVNDTYGHEAGDILIGMAAEIIQNSFGIYGFAYRIGGDEFCVLLNSDNPKQLYYEALPVFEQEIKAKNKTSPKHLQLQIAHGFSICLASDSEAVSASIAAADAAMYNNKKILKNQL